MQKPAAAHELGHALAAIWKELPLSHVEVTSEWEGLTAGYARVRLMPADHLLHDVSGWVGERLWWEKHVWRQWFTAEERLNERARGAKDPRPWFVPWLVSDYFAEPRLRGHFGRTPDGIRSDLLRARTCLRRYRRLFEFPADWTDVRLIKSAERYAARIVLWDWSGFRRLVTRLSRRKLPARMTRAEIVQEIDFTYPPQFRPEDAGF
jgi:hypothetical protein